MRTKHRHMVRRGALRFALVLLMAIAIVPLAGPLLGRAASVLRGIGSIPGFTPTSAAISTISGRTPGPSVMGACRL